MHQRHTTWRRPPRSRSPWTAVIAIALLVILGGCAAYGATSAIRLASEPSRSPIPAPDAAAVVVASPGPTAPMAASAAASIIVPSPEPTPRRTHRPASSASPRPTPGLHPRAHPGPFRMDLYHRNQMVSELEAWWCMPAAMQTIINIIDGGRPDRTYGTQQRLYWLARRLSSDQLDGKGAEPIGWASGLTRLGYGTYVVSVHRSRGDAIRTAAKALRMTGRPVGIVAWRGAHSWVMSGFMATADPALTNHFQVTAVAIEDVWYPRISSIWGPSTPPDTWIPVERLPQDYLPYRRPGVRYPGQDGRFLLVLPVDTVADASR